jgi:hypothetical protein
MNGEKLFRERAIDEKLNTVQLALSFSIQTKLHPQVATGICTVWNDRPKAFKWGRELFLAQHLTPS